MSYEAMFLNLSTDNYQLRLLDPSTNQIKETIELYETENKKIKYSYEKLIIVVKNLSNPKEELVFDLPKCELYTIDKDHRQNTIIKSDKQGRKFDNKKAYSSAPMNNTEVRIKETEKKENFNSNQTNHENKITPQKPSNIHYVYERVTPKKNEDKYSASNYNNTPTNNKQYYSNYKPNMNQPSSNYYQNSKNITSTGNPERSYIANKDQKYIINANQENNLKKNNITYTNNVSSNSTIQNEKFNDLNKKDNIKNYYVSYSKPSNQEPISNFDKNDKKMIDNNRNILNTNIIYYEAKPSFYNNENQKKNYYTTSNTQNNINNIKYTSTENFSKYQSNINPNYEYYANNRSNLNYLDNKNYNYYNIDYSKKDKEKEIESTIKKEKDETNKLPLNVLNKENQNVYSPIILNAELNVANNISRDITTKNEIKKPEEITTKNEIKKPEEITTKNEIKKPEEITTKNEIKIPENQIIKPIEKIDLINRDQNVILNNNISNTPTTNIYNYHDTFDVNKFLKEANIPIIPILTTITTNNIVSNVNLIPEESSKKDIKEDRKISKTVNFRLSNDENVEKNKEPKKNNIFKDNLKKEEIKNEINIKEEGKNKKDDQIIKEKDENPNKLTYENDHAIEKNLSPKNIFNIDSGFKKEEISNNNTNLIIPIFIHLIILI